MEEKEYVPRRAETIAAKRSFRLAEKLKLAGGKLLAKKAWWSNTFFEILFLLIVFSINFYLIFPVFGTRAIDVPFSGPVVPLLAKGVASVFKMELLVATQTVSIFFFLVFPFSFYILVKKITTRKLAGFAAVIISSLPIYLFAATRIKEAFYGLDASHMAGFSIMPLSLYGLLSFLKEGRVRNLIIAVLGSAVLALTSPFAFANFLVFAVIFTFSEMLLGEGRLKLTRFLAVFLFVGGLNSFWYNPAFFIWMITGPFGEGIRATMAKMVPVSFFVLPLLAAFSFLLFDRKPNLQPLFLASFCTIAFLMIFLTGEGHIPYDLNRYLPELGISLAFLSGMLLIKIMDFVIARRMKIIANIAILFIFSSLFAIILFNRNTVLENNTGVLEYSADIGKNEYWQARGKFSGNHQKFGYLITLISIAGMGILFKKQI